MKLGMYSDLHDIRYNCCAFRVMSHSSARLPAYITQSRIEEQWCLDSNLVMAREHGVVELDSQRTVLMAGRLWLSYSYFFFSGLLLFLASTAHVWTSSQRRPHCTLEGIYLCLLCIPHSALGVWIIFQEVPDFLLGTRLDQHYAACHVWAFSFAGMLGESSTSKDRNARVDLWLQAIQVLRPDCESLIESIRVVGDMY